MDEAKRLLIIEQWSPEQISGVLAKEGKYISHETIYRTIRKDKAKGTHCNTFAISIQRACQVYYNGQRHRIRLSWNDKQKPWCHRLFC